MCYNSEASLVYVLQLGGHIDWSGEMPLDRFYSHLEVTVWNTYNASKRQRNVFCSEANYTTRHIYFVHYSETSNMSRIDHSDVVEKLPVGATPITSSFST